MGHSGSRANRRNGQHGCACRQRRLSLLITTVLAASALGCSSMVSIEPLDVTLANLNITEVTVFETTLVAKLRITNPNPDAFTIDGASFKLYLEDKKVGTGTTKETFTVDRLDSLLSTWSSTSTMHRLS